MWRNLITSRYALSASHCFFSTGTDSNLGSSTISLKLATRHRQPSKTVDVTDIIGHPDYDGSKSRTTSPCCDSPRTSTRARPPVRLEWDPEKYAEGTSARSSVGARRRRGAARCRRCSSRQTSPWFRRRRARVRAAIHPGEQASPSQTPCSALDSKMVEPMRAKATGGTACGD